MVLTFKYRAVSINSVDIVRVVGRLYDYYSVGMVYVVGRFHD